MDMSFHFFRGYSNFGPGLIVMGGLQKQICLNPNSRIEYQKRYLIKNRQKHAVLNTCLFLNHLVSQLKRDA